MTEAPPRVALVVVTGLDEYQQRLVSGAKSVLTAHGLALVVNSFNLTGRGLVSAVSALVRHVDPYGVIATPCTTPGEEEELAGILADLGVPVIRLGMSASGVTCIRGDDVTGMRSVMRHLLDEQGIRRPVLVRGTAHQPDAMARERVFREELAVRGIPVDEELVVDGAFWHESTYRELHALLQRRRDMDAVVACNDLSALGALQALTDEGLRVPEDVLLTGFDNDRAAELNWPGLTTVDPDLYAQGVAAAEQLVAKAAGAQDAVKEILVPARLVVRTSTDRQALSDAARLKAVTAVAESAQRQLASRDVQRGLSVVLSSCPSIEDVGRVLGECRPERLGIRRCFFAEFVEAPQDLVPPGDGVLWARLHLSYRDGQMYPVPQEVFPVHRLLPDSLRGELDPGLLIYQPITSIERSLGYLLLEHDLRPGMVIEHLRIDLCRTMEAVISTRALKEHVENLERIVAWRTDELRRANSELERLAMIDSLTRLANRTVLQRHLDQQCRRTIEEGGDLAVVMVDVDLFKEFNDHQGHLPGDEALQVVASCLSQSLGGPDDLACRYGGEEFVLVLPGSDLESALAVVERMRRLLAEAAIPHPTSWVAPVVTVSAGVAVGSARSEIDPRQLLETADKALYQAKEGGRDRVCALEPEAVRRPGPRRHFPRARSSGRRGAGPTG